MEDKTPIDRCKLHHRGEAAQTLTVRVARLVNCRKLRAHRYGNDGVLHRPGYVTSKKRQRSTAIGIVSVTLKPCNARDAERRRDKETQARAAEA